VADQETTVHRLDDALLGTYLLCLKPTRLNLSCV